MHWTAFLAYRRFPANARVADDLACIQCGHNLRSQSVWARCPECGYEVGHSIFLLAKPDIVARHPLLEVRDAAVDLVAGALAQVIALQKYTCYACAIMPDHIHILIRKHKHTAEEMIESLQNAARWALIDSRLRYTDHPVWTRGGWSVFLDHPDEVERTIPYIEGNPEQIHLPRQLWPFVVSYDRWPLHEGHSPNSPYAKRLRAVGRYP